MKNVVLIACSSKKLSGQKPVQTQYLYISPLFKKSLAYARKLAPDRNIFILSAKHRLVPLWKKLKPYNQTLNKMPAREVKQWADKVMKQMKKSRITGSEKVTFLAGERYRRYLAPYFHNASVPLRGKTIGKQLQYLTAKLNHGK